LVSITQRIPIYIFYSLDSKLHIIIMTISSINLSPYSEWQTYHSRAWTSRTFLWTPYKSVGCNRLTLRPV